jgi:hypothetical protein
MTALPKGLRLFIELYKELTRVYKDGKFIGDTAKLDALIERANPWIK